MRRLEKLKNRFNLPHRNYKKEGDNGFNIIIFDIPEKERFKRDWIRQNLTPLGFNMLQKSVWIGRSKLPREFLKDLSNLNLVKYVHIFKIAKTGTIKNIT